MRDGAPATKICQADGTWTQAKLDCIPVRCSLPENPLNGKALFSSTDFGAVVNYEESFDNMHK